MTPKPLAANRANARRTSGPGSEPGKKSFDSKLYESVAGRAGEGVGNGE